MKNTYFVLIIKFTSVWFELERYEKVLWFELWPNKISLFDSDREVDESNGVKIQVRIEAIAILIELSDMNESYSNLNEIM